MKINVSEKLKPSTKQDILEVNASASRSDLSERVCICQNKDLGLGQFSWASVACIPDSPEVNAARKTAGQDGRLRKLCAKDICSSETGKNDFSSF